MTMKVKAVEKKLRFTKNDIRRGDIMLFRVG